MERETSAACGEVTSVHARYPCTRFGGSPPHELRSQGGTSHLLGLLGRAFGGLFGRLALSDGLGRLRRTFGRRSDLVGAFGWLLGRFTFVGRVGNLSFFPRFGLCHGF